MSTQFAQYKLWRCLLVAAATLIVVLAMAGCSGAQPAATPTNTPVPPTPTTIPPKILLIMLEKSNDMELMLTDEVGVMISMLEDAGYKVIVASASGQPLVGGAKTVRPDMKLADVRVDDYAGIIVPCMSTAFEDKPSEAIEIVRKAVALGKPVAAQNSGVGILSDAGVMKGKQFAVGADFVNMVPGGIYKGTGVVQDGLIITSGTCPRLAQITGLPDKTSELTQKFIDILASRR